eukprot:CAMPEP_0172521948 /NCGR_PEP_ID=MMETSP1066-20121228/292861_1 /TAXON_ID=671091 /ORGANISM="Coscinodiscus wailesii, Strain CCMP2513" /LENGTH=409 /DNA_ID=CAMNT_0013304911 /DNA_START=203 /DNA_END=1428 /DNA_ORIENTATION=+
MPAPMTSPDALFRKEVAEARSYESIGLNPSSELYPDIDQIFHKPSRSRVMVILKENARCANPYLVGRLSGRALVKFNFKRRPVNKVGFEGVYKAPFEGRFFLEIVAVFCNYVPNDMSMCLVDGEANLVTAAPVEITVTRSVALDGYWASPVHEPLYTRWQPQNCRLKAEKYTERCMIHGTLDRYDNYEFHTYSKLMDRYKRYDTSSAKMKVWHNVLGGGATKHYHCIRYNSNNPSTAPMCDVCVTGKSHSQRMMRMMDVNVGIAVSGKGVDYPDQITESTAELLVKRCQTVLVGFGQHSLADHYTTEQFEGQLRTLLNRLKDHPRVVGRSVHYNPHGDDKMKCPPNDNRNVAYVDEYNKVYKNVFKEYGRDWIDTRWIEGGLWDAGYDWNHLHYKVELVHAWYITDYPG